MGDKWTFNPFTDKLDDAGKSIATLNGIYQRLDGSNDPATGDWDLGTHSLTTTGLGSFGTIDSSSTVNIGGATIANGEILGVQGNAFTSAVFSIDGLGPQVGFYHKSTGPGGHNYYIFTDYTGYYFFDNTALLELFNFDLAGNVTFGVNNYVGGSGLPTGANAYFGNNLYASRVIATNGVPNSINGYDNTPLEGTTDGYIGGGLHLGLWLHTKDDPNPNDAKFQIGDNGAGHSLLQIQTGIHNVENAGTIILQPYGGNVRTQYNTLDDGSGNMNVTGIGQFASSYPAFIDASNYIYASGSTGASEIDYYQGGSRKMVFGYDSGSARGIFYNDALGMGVYFFDLSGIALGTDFSVFANNQVQIPKFTNFTDYPTNISFNLSNTVIVPGSITGTDEPSEGAYGSFTDDGNGNISDPYLGVFAYINYATGYIYNPYGYTIYTINYNYGYGLVNKFSLSSDNTKVFTDGVGNLSATSLTTTNGPLSINSPGFATMTMTGPGDGNAVAGMIWQYPNGIGIHWELSATLGNALKVSNYNGSGFVGNFTSFANAHFYLGPSAFPSDNGYMLHVVGSGYFDNAVRYQGSSYGDVSNNGGWKSAYYNLADGSDKNYTLSVYAAGTVYSLTLTPALMTFGTTSPSLTINKAGTYLIKAYARVLRNNSTHIALHTISFKLRRTNNTAADLTNGSTTYADDAHTGSSSNEEPQTIDVIYTTANTNDVIQFWGSVSAAGTGGTHDVDEARIIAERLY